MDSRASTDRAIAFEIPQIAGFSQHFERKNDKKVLILAMRERFAFQEFAKSACFSMVFSASSKCDYPASTDHPALSLFARCEVLASEVSRLITDSAIRRRCPKMAAPFPTRIRLLSSVKFTSSDQ